MDKLIIASSNRKFVMMSLLNGINSLRGKEDMFVILVLDQDNYLQLLKKSQVHSNVRLNLKIII